MALWHHSGIEGYCKAAARMMGLPDNNSGWGNFGRDLFADGRFDDAVRASKTWTLSRFRNLGRSNRPTLFEKSWLGQSGSNLEIDAIHTCAHSICDARTDSALAGLYHADRLAFAPSFRSTVLPAIEDGFRTERYHPADIARFSQGIDRLLGELNPSLPQTFRNFVVPLVAGLIYGPDHIIARSNTESATLRNPHRGLQGLFEHGDISPTTVRITQLFDKSASLCGFSGLFDANTVVFFGRNANIPTYLEKCDPSFAHEIAGLEPIVFPVASTHKSTSKEHGAIARLGETWYYHDFSANGSLIQNADIQRAVHDNITVIAPGDHICLGQAELDDDTAAAYRLATTVLVSFNVEETVL